MRPVPKARPRPNPRGGVYTPSQAEEEALAMALRPGSGAYPSGQVHVELVFWLCMGSPGDGDNYEKLVLDALQKAGVYSNDRQVRSCAWWVEQAEHPADERYDIVVRRPAVHG
jgi:Endodeoxyribonuclease RusA